MLLCIVKGVKYDSFNYTGWLATAGAQFCDVIISLNTSFIIIKFHFFSIP